MPESGMLCISRLGKVAGVSVMMTSWNISLYIALRYRSSSFIVRADFPDDLVPRSKMQPYKSVHQPWKLVSALGSGLGLFLGLWIMYFLVLESCFFYLSFGIFDSLPSGRRDSFDSTTPSTFPWYFLSYVEFTFFVCRNLYGLVKTEISINFLLSSTLDR